MAGASAGAAGAVRTARPAVGGPLDLEMTSTQSLGRPRAVAIDFDDTLAEDGVVEPAVLDGLRRLRASGLRLVLVTGREIDDLVHTFPAVTVFDRVVGENGAVLYRP
jgi:predicted mannosyl-3-phosphoglycerate phosphatase (HAD superfamily)